jgi:hypothetical protein
VIVDAAQWLSLDAGAAEAVARLVAARSGAEPAGVRVHEYAGRRAPVALFTVGGERFAFVPGGEVTVGFDGGSAVCGGSGSFLSWLSVATAYRDVHHAAAVAGGDDYGTMRVRPAIQLT